MVQISVFDFLTFPSMKLLQLTVLKVGLKKVPFVSKFSITIL